jgi:hypothetical protein
MAYDQLPQDVVQNMCEQLEILLLHLKIELKEVVVPTMTLHLPLFQSHHSLVPSAKFLHHLENQR